jgi:hypothetical protein
MLDHRYVVFSIRIEEPEIMIEEKFYFPHLLLADLDGVNPLFVRSQDLTRLVSDLTQGIFAALAFLHHVKGALKCQLFSKKEIQREDLSGPLEFQNIENKNDGDEDIPYRDRSLPDHRGCHGFGQSPFLGQNVFMFRIKNRRQELSHVCPF